MALFEGIPFVCCQGPKNTEACCCSHEEAVVRLYAAGSTGVRPMTEEERAWCCEEALRAGEGYYQSQAQRAQDDSALAHSTLNAWNLYVRSHF